MARNAAITLILISLINIAAAAQAEVMIDDFEDGDISDWHMLYDIASEEQNITLVGVAHSGDYAIQLWDSDTGYFVDFAKENIDIELPHPFSYYNLSFWYYVKGDCEFPHYSSREHKIYLSAEDTFAWSAVEVKTGHIMGCNGWQRINLALDDPENEIFGSFYLNSTHLGSINIENGENAILYDDIKLIPKISEGFCIPEWDCTDWGACIGGNQSRTCVDTNNCNDILDMPETEQSCGIIAKIIEPTRFSFSPGDIVTIRLNVTYTDSSSVSGLNLSVSLCNKELPLDEAASGIYSVTCVVRQSDIGQWNMTLNGVDAQIDTVTLNITEAPGFDLTSLILAFLQLSPVIVITITAAITVLFIYYVIKWLKSRVKRRKVKKEEKPKKKQGPEGLHKIRLG